ncbi:MAG: hypothetical protein LUE27_04515 [Clostridia bacterium]|nr:hypothetical protein [Clostridia bacterium]
MKSIRSSLLRSAALLAAALFAVLAISLSLAVKSAGTGTYTVYADEDYYSETTHFATESAFDSYLKASSGTAAFSEATESLGNNTEFTSATAQSMWVCETEDENGVVNESRLLSKAEVEEIENGDASIKLLSSGETEIGSDTESYYKLTIVLEVLHNTSNGYYTVTGTASWDKIVSSSSKKSAEENYEDYIGLTWGGNGAFKALSYSASGTYYNGKSATMTRCISDTYNGYVWQFYEKSGFLGKELENATVTANISLIGAEQGKETNAKLTYIHTYGTLESGFTVSLSSNGSLSAGLTMSSSENAWQIQVDVSGIPY